MAVHHKTRWMYKALGQHLQIEVVKQARILLLATLCVYHYAHRDFVLHNTLKMISFFILAPEGFFGILDTLDRLDLTERIQLKICLRYYTKLRVPVEIFIQLIISLQQR